MTSQSRVRMARRYAGMSQVQLALRVGVQRSAVSHWEARNSRNPSVSHLRLIAEVAKVQFEWLATGRGTMTLSTEAVLDTVLAAHALLIDDALEMRLVSAFRDAPVRARVALVEVVEQLAAARIGRLRTRPAVNQVLDDLPDRSW